MMRTTKPEEKPMNRPVRPLSLLRSSSTARYSGLKPSTKEAGKLMVYRQIIDSSTALLYKPRPLMTPFRMQ